MKGRDVRLSEVPVGGSAVVRTVAPGNHGQGRRLEDLGVIAGTEVRVERLAPFGDPTIYEVRNALLAIRRHDAQLVDVDTAAEDASRSHDVAL
jgi:Fe2+ transport system protein FeoA